MSTETQTGMQEDATSVLVSLKNTPPHAETPTPPKKTRVPDLKQSENDKIYEMIAIAVKKHHAHLPTTKKGETLRRWGRVKSEAFDTEKGPLRNYKEPKDCDCFKWAFLAATGSRFRKVRTPGTHSNSHAPQDGEDNNILRASGQNGG